MATDYLPLTRANVIRQAFKFLGERYGWGHSYNARDCSGFVSEVYRSFGVQLPRNTRDQAVSPALNRFAFSPDDSHARRVEVLKTLQVGDLIYIPGHVMMVIGQEKDGPYVIHDTTGITYRKTDGELTPCAAQWRVGDAADAAAVQRNAADHRPHHQHPAHQALNEPSPPCPCSSFPRKREPSAFVATTRSHQIPAFAGTAASTPTQVTP